MTITSKTSDTDEAPIAVDVEEGAAANLTPHEMTVEGVPVEGPPPEKKGNWLIEVGLVLFLIGYTLVQIYAITTERGGGNANLLVGVLAVILCIIFGCFVLQRHACLVTSISGVYCGILGIILWFFRTTTLYR